MGTTLIINPGSSSKKFALFKAGKLVASWHFEQTGQGFSVCLSQDGVKGHCQDVSATEFRGALPHVIAAAVQEGFIAQKQEIVRVGIRVVAPATYFTTHRVVDKEYLKKLEVLEPLAPHHIAQMVLEIKEIMHELPESLLIGVSDSAFHVTAPSPHKKTGLPREEAMRYDIHRFGYHGISVGSIVKHVMIKEGTVPERMVVCHVGSGVSVTGVVRGESIGNSMGYTPVSGVMMSSRMGDVSADAFAAVIVRKGIEKGKLFQYLYNEGGFKGLVGVKDLRLVLDLAEKGDQDAKEALAVFALEVRSYIAHFAMLMGGIDLIVLTATAAERNPAVRSLLVGQLPLFETYVHNDRNEALLNSEGYIHTDESRVRIVVLKTDELGEMYRVVTQFG